MPTTGRFAPARKEYLLLSSKTIARSLNASLVYAFIQQFAVVTERGHLIQLQQVPGHCGV